MSRFHNLCLSTLSLIALVGGEARAQAADGFGKVGAVNPDATGTPPGGAAKTLSVGADVVVKERVRTSASGSTQILFPDQSSLNVGANSDMVIDEYYYNPNAKSGNMVAKVSKGVLRYIGGQISHTSGATINTPSAVLGIRGGIVSIMLPLPPQIAASDSALKGLSGELVIAHFGSISIQNNVGQTWLQPGFATVIGSANTPITTPFRLPDGTLHLLMIFLASQPGQTGGATHPPTGQSLPVPQGFTMNFLPNPSHPPGVDPLGYSSVFSYGNSVTKNKAQNNQAQTAQQQASMSGSPPASGGPYYHFHDHHHHHHYYWGWGWGWGGGGGIGD